MVNIKRHTEWFLLQQYIHLMSCHGFLHVDTLGSRVGAKIMPGKQKKKNGRRLARLLSSLGILSLSLVWRELLDFPKLLASVA